MTNLLTRIHTLSTAAVFWLGLIGMILTVTLRELEQYPDDPAIAAVVGVLGPVLTGLGTIILIVRRVTEVIEPERGLLPVDYPTPVKHQPDGGYAVTEVLWTVALLLACVALLIWIVPELAN